MKIQKKIVFALSKPLGLVSRPYAVVSKQLKMDEKELLSRILEYKNEGVIRRVGVVLGHFKVGYKCNALVLWKVKDKDMEVTGKMFAASPAITHCYARRTYPQWPYSLYTMVHAKSRKESLSIIKALSRKSGIKDYKIQFTVKEFKKIKSDLKEILS